MTSPNDNISLKNGLSATYKMRAKDTSAAQDGTLQSVRHLATPYPVDYGTGGCFQMTLKSGLIGAGAGANSPVFSFRWTSSTLLAIVRRLRIHAWSVTGFTAGLATFDMFACRSWTAADTGGQVATVTGNNGNMRTDMPASVIGEIRFSNTGVLTAGTRTKDAQMLETITKLLTNVANTPFWETPYKLFDKLGAEHPLVLAQNEGFTIEATVPATGTWKFAITPEWDEVPLVNY